MKRRSTSTSSNGSRSKTYFRRAYDYALRQSDPKRPVPKYIRQQAQRFIDRIDNKKYPFSKKDLELWGEFIETLPCPEGAKREDIVLRDWQCWLLAELIGFRRADDPEKRLVEELFLVVPRKAGKSTLGAAVCLADICVGGRNGPVVVNAGPTEHHARHIYRRGCRMVNQSDDLKKYYSLKASGRQIVRNDESNAIWYPESGQLKDGEIPTTYTYDEPHASRDKEGMGVIRTSFATIENPLFLMTTTAGDLIDSVGLDERERVIAEFKGFSSDPGSVGLLYEFDDEMGLEEDDPKAWEAVHPMLGDTVSEDWYMRQWLLAKTNQDKLHSFRTRLLCRWGRGDANVLIPLEQWDALDASPDFYDVRKGDFVRAWIGLDTADNVDLTSITVIGELASGMLQAWWRVFVPRSQIPEEAVYMDEGKEPGSVSMYNSWARDGWLRIGGERRIDNQVIAGEVSRLADKFPVRAIIIDQHSGADEVWEHLSEQKREMVFRLPKSANNFTSPCRELKAKVEDKAIQAEKHPVARWAVENAVVEPRINGSLLPIKPTVNSPHKIDALDSLLLALAGRMVEQKNAPKRQPMRITDIQGFGSGIPLFI